MKLDAELLPVSDHGPQLLRRVDLGAAGSTLSSWDSCMSKAYCKWPVIAAIIVGSLILLSILFCIARCCCCGLECCCGCFACCNACCPKPRGKKSYATPQQPPPPAYGQWGGQQGPQPWAQAAVYRAPPQQPQPYETGLMSGGVKSERPKATPAPVNTARFSVEKPLAPMEQPKPYRNPKNDDQLPSMPTWADASEQHIEDETYHPRADTPPGESEIAQATGQQGVLLQDRKLQRRPTLPDMEGNTAPKLERRPTLPTVDSSISGGTSAPYGSSTALPASQSSILSPGGGGADGALVAGAGLYNHGSRTPVSRKQTSEAAYGYGAPPRRPSDRQPPHPHENYPPYQDRSHTVSPISPMAAGHQRAGIATSPMYGHRQNASGWPMRSPTSPNQRGHGAPLASRAPPVQNFSSPISPTPPPNQWNGSYSTAPQRAASVPRPAPSTAQLYQAYNPYNGQSTNQSSQTIGRAELGGADVGGSELHGAEAKTPRYELGGGEGVGEGGHWQRRPPGGWS